MDSKPLPVIYVQEMPGRYYCRIEGDVRDIPIAAKIFTQHFRREPGAAYIDRGFIYFPLSEAEAGSLITLAVLR